MKILILNGDMAKGKSNFSNYIEKLAIGFQLKNNEVKVFHLHEEGLNYCIGCFSCWWRTPGVCTHKKDSGDDILQEYMKSDFVIFASPLSIGFFTSALKKTLDRFIALLHPYLETRNGALRHSRRYEKYPEFGFLIEEEEDTDEEDLQILKGIIDRIAINFFSKQPYLLSVKKQTVDELVNTSMQTIKKD